jgi:elongation factor Ts
MPITADQVKQLREMTGAGMMECKQALAEASGDLDKAVDALRKSGAAKVARRSGRTANEGRVDAYIHPGNRVGVLIEINCETDFVARTDEFAQLVRNLAMQVAAAGAEYVRREEVPADRIARERDVLGGQKEHQGKPAAILEKIIEGKLNKFFAEVCLLEQPYIRDDKRTIAELVEEAAGKTGENIVVRRFARFRLGQE